MKDKPQAPPLKRNNSWAEAEYRRIHGIKAGMTLPEPVKPAKDTRSFGQQWADRVTQFSGSWPFIIWFVVLCAVWIVINLVERFRFDPYPFMFLNWVLTVVSTFQNPLIMLSQNRQNEMDQAKTEEILAELRALREEVKELRNR